MILYTNSCLACTNKPLWKKLRQYAAANRLIIEQRRTDRSQEHRVEAEQYGLLQPFVVINGMAKRAGEL